GATQQQVASIGVACHIFSAAPAGPRGQGGLAPAQLRDAENGFWACQDHAKLVDTNEGKRYPAGVLLGWRALHESRIHREMGGVRLPVYWIEGIEIHKAPGFRSRQRLTLSRVTLLLGNNGSGKSALCDWLGSSAEDDAMSRWLGADLSFELKVHNPEEHVFAVESLREGFSFRLDGVNVPFNPLRIVVQTLSHPPPLRNGRSDVDWMAGWLGVTSEMIRRLATSLAHQSNPFAESASVGDSGEIEAKLRIEPKSHVASRLSGGGQVMLALALATARARNASLHAPTLLVVDGSLHAFDARNRTLVLEELGRIEHFQSLVTFPDDPTLVWTGWSVVHVKDDPGGGALIDGI
ncbi:MAG: hypothetical protein ACRENE_11335, partial [Polyangiaceae bacterium]